MSQRLAMLRPGVVLWHAASLLLLWTGLLQAEPRRWHYLQELSAAERQNIDLRTDTPRDPTLPYLPAEPYPFTPPYTAEEMGFRAMEFPHMARWSHVQIEDFGTITPSGYLFNGKIIVLVTYTNPEGLEGYLKTKPGAVYTRWLSQDIAPPQNFGNQLLMLHHRTDMQFTTKTHMFGYSPLLRRVRRFPQPRRQDRFPDQPITFDDFLGRDAWEFTWRIIGTDVLTETVRFPRTRQTITLTSAAGDTRDVSANSLKLMGEQYPFYTADGGVPCYVVEAKAKPDWLPHYYAPRILYWLDQHAFYPLRTELYGPDGALVSVEVRMAAHYHPDLRERGYHNLITVWWNAQLDFLAYTVHDGHQRRQWSVKDQEVYFNPDFMRREWFPVPMKTQATVRTPEEAFLRPHLHRDTFPAERTIILAPEIDARIQAQDAAGHLVFTEMVAERQQQVPRPTETQQDGKEERYDGFPTADGDH
jgi:hypothetical protein